MLPHPLLLEQLHGRGAHLPQLQSHRGPLQPVLNKSWLPFGSREGEPAVPVRSPC